MRKVTLIIALAGILVASAVHGYVSPGSPTGYVNDFADVISNDIEASLEESLEAFEQETGHEVAVVTITSLQGDDIESYANTLFREWGIGKEESNNGVLFIASIEDRKMRIEVGYGLEGALTDIETKYIQDDLIVPQFRSGNYGQGIADGVEEIKKAIEGEVIVEESESRTSLGEWLGNVASGGIGTIMILVIVFAFFEALLAPSKSWWLGGVIGMILGGIIGAIVTSWIVIPILAVLGLLFDFFVSRNYRPGRGGNDSFFGGGWSSGGSSSSSSGGSSFGGFGGGSSGGGGSSSSW